MLEQFLTVLGPNFAVPAALLLLGAWCLHVLVGLNDSKRRNRIEFLDVWRDIEDMDDLRLEVTIRHLVGTFFPASVIRAINRSPFPAQTLFDLSEIWSLVRFDPHTLTLGWKKPAYGNQSKLRRLKALAFGSYVACALIATASLGLAVGTDPAKVSAWISGLNTALFLALAVASLARFDALSAIHRDGATLLRAINAADAASGATDDK